MRPTWIPAGLLAIASIALASGRLDLWIADHGFYDASAQGWVGAGSWWALHFIHTGGKWLVRLVGLLALAAWAATVYSKRLHALRRSAAFVVASLVLCPMTVGLLQQATNVDCPRDLSSFGGNRPYVPLFADRPDELPRGQCFPGSHSASGFALMSFYFVLLGPRPRLARRVLVATAALGVVFSIGQQARGAHFLSHDLASAAIVWILLLVLYRRLLEFPAAGPRRLIPPQADVSPSDRFPRSGPGFGRRPATHPAHARGRRAGVRDIFRRLFLARLPLRPASPEWRRRGDARSRAVHAHEGDAEARGLPRRIGPVHLDLPDLPP